MARASEGRGSSLTLGKPMRAVYAFALIVGLCGCVSRTVHTFGTTVVSLKWSPTESEVARCEQALARKVSYAGRRLDRYCVRMYAYEQAGRQVIVGYAADCETPGSKGLLMPERARSVTDPSFDPAVVLRPFGGGNAYFEFRYDREQSRLTEFHFNAAL